MGKSFYDFDVNKGWLTTLEEVLEKIPEEQQKDFLTWARGQHLKNNWRKYLDEIPDKEFMKEVIATGVRVRENAAVAESTKVGVVLVTYDNGIFPGSNQENPSKHINHAEEVALSYAVGVEGYVGTDFHFMVQIFKSSRTNSQEVYPACIDCLADLWDRTHPDLIIVNVTPDAKELYATKLGDLVAGFQQGPIRIYPSPVIKSSESKKSLFKCYKPKLGGLSPYYNKWYDEEGNARF